MPTKLPAHLRHAYEQAVYCINVANSAQGELEVRIGQHSAGVDKLLEQHAVASAAFITACNPASELLNDDDNAVRHAALYADVQAAVYKCLQGEGRDPGGTCPAERSLLILGIEHAAAAKLSQHCGQSAWVWLVSGCPAELV